ncbi:eukaryotic translation initiation factor 3 subunit M-like [Oppia nitens]|uniref:eukaryotic translation initiation factor 3 subunit M-like n=1 Tax=Oppia nitens TaxID=1686743 RepID=UPI0023DC26D4|nr:eukaryotic translation initiation factor 3 subunit M-like [Oppia nitens]
MSIPTFIDITETEQCEELREYLTSLGATLGQKSDTFVSELKQIIGVSDTLLTESDKDADTESVLNSIVSLLLTSVPQSSPECSLLVNHFCEQLLKANNAKTSLVCLRVLKNLFSGLIDVDLRFRVYETLVRLAAISLQIGLVFEDTLKLKEWFPVKTVGTERWQRLLRLLHEVLLSAKQSEAASRVLIELLSTYTEDNASQARDDAHRCIVFFLSDRNTFLMDHLLALKPVKILEGEPIHDLLTIFVAEKLSAYIKFYNARKDFVDSLGLNHEQNLQKMRLLTFMQMAESRKEIPFDAIQHDLQLNPDQVESFVIDVLRTKLVRAKVDQVNHRVLVSSTMHRTFGRPQWIQLRETLHKWAQNLAKVQHTVHVATSRVDSVGA